VFLCDINCLFYIDQCKGLLYQWLWFPSMQSSSTGAANLLQRPLFIIPWSKFPNFSHLLLWIQALTINWPPTADFHSPEIQATLRLTQTRKIDLCSTVWCRGWAMLLSWLPCDWKEACCRGSVWISDEIWFQYLLTISDPPYKMVLSSSSQEMWYVSQGASNMRKWGIKFCSNELWC